MAELSPAAQAIRAAALATYDSRVRRDEALWRLEQPGVVAALRAAADQLGYAGAGEAAAWISEIAAELAGTPTITTETTDG